MSINTKTVKVRLLRFNSLDQVRAEADRLAAAERAGKLTRLGNWQVGQLFGHLAWWIDGAYDGYPMTPPWYLKLLAPLLKRRMLTQTPPQGFRMPGAPGGAYGTEVYTLDEGLSRLQRALARLQAAPPTRPNPVFGRLTHDEWMRLHTRHAEGHLRFLVVEGEGGRDG